eukprot:15480226-Alexandrium_andersonii.AAC.1
MNAMREGGEGSGAPPLRAGWGRAGNCCKTPQAGCAAAVHLVPHISHRSKHLAGHFIKVSSGPKVQPEGAVVPARSTGQTALSAAPNRR